MIPLQRSARRARPRKARAFLAAREGLEIRVVPALVGAEPTALAIAPASLLQTGPQPVEPASVQLSDLAQAGGTPITPDGGNGSPTGYTPQQIRTGYGIDDIKFGSITGDGTGQTIAIVDAYDDPGLVDSSSPSFRTSDLAQFDLQFNLPDPPSFTKVNEFGSTTDLPVTDPAGAGNPDGNWEAEEAMDVEWAHAIAPGANIILVEAASSSFSDLYDAIATAADLSGVSVISLSWGSPEFSGETQWDSYFQTPAGHQGVTFVAASGDGGAPGIDPAYSPNVVAAGGTTLSLGSDGTYESEIGWYLSGGGPSSYEPEPAYQDGVQSTGYRTIPDVSFDADRSPGVAVYDSYDNTGGGPWDAMGGTSVAAPAWAALIAIADQGRVAMGGTTLDGPTQTLPALYSLPAADFHDITTGYNGYYTAPGYDEVTGLGTPVANLLVPDLAAYGLPDQLVVTAQPASSVNAGSSFGLTVAVESPGGQPLPGATGTVTLSLANDPGGAGLNGTLTATLDQGVATFSGLSIDRAGAGYSLLVTAGGFDSATSSAFDVVPAAPAQLIIGAQPSTSVTAGGGFGLTIDVEDAFGNIESRFGGSVTLALAANPAGGSLGGDLTTTASDGVADFSGLTIDKAGTGYTIQATASGLSAATTQSFDITASTPAQLVVSSEPAQAVTAGTGFGLGVLVEDAYGNIETSYDGRVTVALTGGPSGASLGGTLTRSANIGVADFSGLILTETGSSYTLDATSNGLTAATTTPFAVTPAAPAQLAITTEPPSSVTAGAGFGLAVAVEDAFGNAEPSYSGNVTIALTGGTGLGGTLTIPARDGVADFSGLSLDQAGGGYAIQAGATGLSSATTTPFAVTPAAPAQLVITDQPPSSITAGAGFGLAVAVEDAYGNAEPSYSDDVTITLTGGTGLAGTLTIPARDGVADFSGLSLDRTGSGYAIQAGAAGLSSATTTAFAVTPAAPAQLVITTEPPSSVTAGAGFGLAVAVEDAFGNAEPSYSGNVTIALTGGTGLGGTLTIPARDGATDFSGLTIDQVGSAYAIQAGAAGLSSATTTAFAVTPAAPSQLAITDQPPSSITAGAGFGLSVSVEDAFGNAEPSYIGNVSVTLTGRTGLGGTLTIPTSNGVASFSGLTLDRAESGYTLHAADIGLTGASTTAFQVTPSAASQLVTVAQPPDSVAAGQSFGFTIAAEDPFGNVVTGFDGTVTASMADDRSDAPLSGALTVTANRGLASFSGLTIDQAGSGYALKTAAGNLSDAATAPIAVSPTSATRLVVTARPPASVTAGSGFGLMVAAEDAFGNVVTSFQGNVTATLVGGPDAGVLGGQATATAVNGVANFSGLTIDQAAAGDSLQFAVGGLSTATTNPFAVNPAAPARLVFISQPPGKIPARQTFDIVAAVEDAFGNVETDYNGTVSVSLADDPRHAKLHGSLTVPVSAGVAVFDGSMSKKLGPGYSLSITGNGLTPTTSDAFKVTHPNPAQSVFSARFRHGRVRAHASHLHSHRGR
jgi:pantothenate kinase type III